MVLVHLCPQNSTTWVRSMQQLVLPGTGLHQQHTSTPFPACHLAKRHPGRSQAPKPACRTIISSTSVMVFEPDTPSATKFEEIAIARREQAAEALELRGTRGNDPNFIDDGETPAAFELDMLESALILSTGELGGLGLQV